MLRDKHDTEIVKVPNNSEDRRPAQNSPAPLGSSIGSSTSARRPSSHDSAIYRIGSQASATKASRMILRVLGFDDRVRTRGQRNRGTLEQVQEESRLLEALRRTTP